MIKRRAGSDTVRERESAERERGALELDGPSIQAGTLGRIRLHRKKAVRIADSRISMKLLAPACGFGLDSSPCGM